MSQELATRPDLFNTPARQETQPQDTGDVGALLRLAVERGVSPESMEKLVDLQMRVMAKQAEMAFNSAIQAFQSSCPNVLKNRTGNFKNTYASLDHIVAVIRPHLEANGLSFSFDADETEGQLTTVCHVHHVAGHSRPGKFVCMIDKSAKQLNSMQQAASAQSYGRRYALLNVLGITTADEDDDGASVPKPPERDESAPVAQTRSERVSKDQCKAIWQRYQSIIQGDKDQFEQWVSETAGMPRGDVSNPSRWVQKNVSDCTEKLDRAEAARP